MSAPSNETTSSSAGPASLRIEGDLVISTVADWHRQIAELLRRAGPVTIDLSGVTAADVFGLQLLIATRLGAAASARTVTFAGAPPCLAATAASAGIDSTAYLAP